MSDVLKLQCTCPVCGSRSKLGGQLDLYGVSLSKTPLEIDQLPLFMKWMENGRWPAATLLDLADKLSIEKDWFQCASCDYLFPIPAASVHALKLLALTHKDPEWLRAVDSLLAARTG